MSINHKYRGKKTKNTAKVREHPHTRPARQPRQGVEPRLTKRDKNTERKSKKKQRDKNYIQE